MRSCTTSSAEWSIRGRHPELDAGYPLKRPQRAGSRTLSYLRTLVERQGWLAARGLAAACVWKGRSATVMSPTSVRGEFSFNSKVDVTYSQQVVAWHVADGDDPARLEIQGDPRSPPHGLRQPPRGTP